ncbi:MAG: hypothetical protein PHP02_01785 [Eubacteriales bacterium]|nr:hypothetical protein [Eubacteriales bacterium]
MKNSVGKSRTDLPYLNNLPMALVVCIINLPLAFLVQYGRALTVRDFVIDAAICGVVTAFTSLAYTRWAVGSRRAHGALPAQVPTGAFVQRMPRSYFPLAVLTGTAAATLMALITWALLTFYSETDYTFPRFLAWKIGYSILLAAKVIEFGIFRHVQPDLARPSDPPQKGRQTVINPLPRREMFSRLYASVTTDFGMNMLLGLVLGGTIIQGDMVVLTGVAQSGVVITGLVLGIIVSLLMVRPTLASVQQIALAGNLPPAGKPNRFLSALPANPWVLAGVLLLPVMALSSLSLWAVMRFFGFETLNFFQFFIIRTAYTKLLSRLAEALAVHRYRQLPLPETKPLKLEVEPHV